MRLVHLVAPCLLTACFDTAPTIGGSEDSTAAASEVSGSEADTTGGGLTVTVRGKLIDALGLTMATEGIKIELVDDPDVFTLSDADGAFALSGVPAGGPSFLASPPTTEFIGGIVGVDAQFADVEGLTLPRLSKLQIEGIVDALKAQDPNVDYDASKGALYVTSTHTDTTITIEPMPVAGNFYALDFFGSPILDQTASQYLLPSVVFFNLPPGAAGSLEITAMHATVSCAVPLASPPILAGHVALSSAKCG